MKQLKAILREIGNLYIGFIHNPIVSLNNRIVDRLQPFSDDLEAFNQENRAIIRSRCARYLPRRFGKQKR